jgi:DNA polymerase-1
MNNSDSHYNESNMGHSSKLLYKLFLDQQHMIAIYPVMITVLKEKDLMNIFQHIEVPLISLLSIMEVRGVHLSVDKMEVMANTIRQNVVNLNNEAYKLLGRSINLGSADQVAHVLYEELRLPVSQAQREIHRSNTNKQHYSTSEDELLKITHLHPIVDIVLQYRY